MRWSVALQLRVALSLLAIVARSPPAAHHPTHSKPLLRPRGLASAAACKYDSSRKGSISLSKILPLLLNAVRC
jgi:hypothetical protein